MSAYSATAILLARSVRAIPDLELPAASNDRISFAWSMGAVVCSILPVLVSQSGQHWKAIRRGSRAGSRGATISIYLLNFSCSRRSFPGDHSDHFIVNINTCPSSERIAELCGIGEDNARQLNET